MKIQSIIIISMLGLIVQCKKNETQKVEKVKLLIAENIYDLSGNIKLNIFSDSTFIFNVFEPGFNYEKIEKFNGRCYQKKDTIYFTPFEFEYNDSEKAVIKNNFIEFVGGKFPLKIEIKENKLKSISSLNFEKYKDYAIFSFDQNFYSPTYYDYKPNTIKAVDLDQNDLIKVDKILKKCFSENRLNLKDFNNYVKQCITVMNSKNEKEVWISLYCKDYSINKEYKYSTIRMNDGGNCNINLKINLTKENYSELNIAGEA
ncbi:hypothetical protein LZZ90_13935 [Flavobacterium sp. SM15]|uniref:hypothetical protein n=1 Tax=Flavobacterium sp. SM15 TaxID=2908005 RepID=UPI001EDB888E|nr:hypothetical protein [Flavobacterium sp. SM15]MCG2612606.1 hypothetical protein [Flavobacterium sp. SM15]